MLGPMWNLQDELGIELMYAMVLKDGVWLLDNGWLDASDIIFLGR